MTPQIINILQAAGTAQFVCGTGQLRPASSSAQTTTAMCTAWPSTPADHGQWPLPPGTPQSGSGACPPCAEVLLLPGQGHSSWERWLLPSHLTGCGSSRLRVQAEVVGAALVCRLGCRGLHPCVALPQLSLLPRWLASGQSLGEVSLRTVAAAAAVGLMRQQAGGKVLVPRRCWLGLLL